MDDDDIYHTIGGEEDIKPEVKSTLQASHHQSALKKKSATPTINEPDKPPPLPPRKVTMFAITPVSYDECVGNQQGML